MKKPITLGTRIAKANPTLKLGNVDDRRAATLSAANAAATSKRSKMAIRAVQKGTSLDNPLGGIPGTFRRPR